jgi:uncharacterized FlgJ-related protein
MKLYRYNPNTLEYKRIPYLYNIFKTIVLIFGASFLLGGKTPLKTEYITDTESIILIQDQNKFTEEKLIAKIKELNFKFPHIVLAQAKLETGTYSSRIFKENNNLFGMKEARVRLNLAQGTQYGHAYYNDWEESVMDYALWYASYASDCRSEKQLYRLLDRQYAEADQYVSSLKHIVLTENLTEIFN